LKHGCKEDGYGFVGERLRARQATPRFGFSAYLRKQTRTGIARH
jgi:hypothetical protein